MSKHAIKPILVAVSLLGAVGVSSAALAQADDDCLWQDRSNSIRCFDCLNRVWTGSGWRLVNTCVRRGAAPSYGWGYPR